MKILAALCVLLLIAVLGLGWYGSHAGARAETAERDLRDVRTELGNATRTLEEERSAARELNRAGTDHEVDRREAEAVPAAVVAAIGDGTLRLRRQWAECETSRLAEATAGTVERDALAQLRRKDQGDLVRVGRDANDHVNALRTVIAVYESRGLINRDGATR